jgi:hypothetical protein
VILSEKILSRIACLVATGDGEGLRNYLGYVLPSARELKILREAMPRRFTSEFCRLAIEVAPWIEGDSLAHPTKVAPADRIRQALREAGTQGLRRGELGRIVGESPVAVDDLVAAGEVVGALERGNGPPATRYYLAENAAGVVPIDHDRNPFALTV